MEHKISGNAATATKIDSITNSDIVQLNSTQTLTNKTLSSPVIDMGNNRALQAYQTLHQHNTLLQKHM